MLEHQILSSKCRDILRNNNDVLTYIKDEIFEEQMYPITESNMEGIALEYTRREGIKQGVLLFIQKINSKADVKD